METMTEQTAKILTRLIAICSKSEKCESEAQKYMTQHGATTQETQLAIEYLTDKKYIDNARYARAYVNDKMKLNKWGKQRIIQQLKLKKISNSDIQQAIDEIWDSDSEKQTITIELAKKLRGISNEPRQKKWEKLMRFSTNRGYPIEICKTIVEKIIQELEQ